MDKDFLKHANELVVSSYKISATYGVPLEITANFGMYIYPEQCTEEEMAEIYKRLAHFFHSESIKLTEEKGA